MSRGSYTRAIDMWSVGCVFGELLQRVSYLGKAATPQLQVGGWGASWRRLQAHLPSLAAAASSQPGACMLPAYWVCVGLRARLVPLQALPHRAGLSGSRLVPLQAPPHRAGLIGSRLVPLQALPHSAPPTRRWPPCLPSKACPAPQLRARHSRAPAIAPSARWVRPNRAAAPPPLIPHPLAPCPPPRALPIQACLSHGVCVLPGMDLRPLAASRAWGVGFFDGLYGRVWRPVTCPSTAHAVLRRARCRK